MNRSNPNRPPGARLRRHAKTQAIELCALAIFIVLIVIVSLNDYSAGSGSASRLDDRGAVASLNGPAIPPVLWRRK